MSGMDWDKARNDVRCAERGVEPVWGPGPPPRRPRTPAPLHVRDGNVGRLRDEFAGRSYAQQLAQIAPIRDRLIRLFGDEDDAQRTLEKQFKPLLRKPGTGSGPRVVRLPAARPATAAGSGRGAKSSAKMRRAAPSETTRASGRAQLPKPTGTRITGRAATALSASASAKAAVARAASAPPARPTRKQRAAARRAAGAA